jgi:site-specific DNA-methyltransferase (adenine-specific)
VLVDNNEQALQVMARRFDGVPDIEWVGFDPRPFQAQDGQTSLIGVGLSTGEGHQ